VKLIKLPPGIMGNIDAQLIYMPCAKGWSNGVSEEENALYYILSSNKLGLLYHINPRNLNRDRTLTVIAMFVNLTVEKLP
jgi:hypothetical protein